MISVREGRGPWASSQFELQRLIGSGKTSNVYQVSLRLPCIVAHPSVAENLPHRRAAFAPVWLLR